MPKITEIYAFVVTEDSGDEGIMATLINNSWMPLVGADMTRVKSLIPYAEDISKSAKKPYKILKFQLVEEIQKR